MDTKLKNVKIEKEVWRELAKNKIERNLQRISDVIKENSIIAKKFANEPESTVFLEKEVRDNLKKFGLKGEDYNDIIKRLIENVKPQKH